jgi:hypothetical protein
MPGNNQNSRSHTLMSLQIQLKRIGKTLLWGMNHHVPGGEPNIWVFGSRRSGSTLLMQVIASNPRMKYCDQPMAPRSSSEYDLQLLEEIENGPFLAPTENIADQVSRYIHEVTSGRLHVNEPWNPWTSDFKFRTDRIVFKVTDHLHLCDWVEKNHNGEIVVLVRHPIAQAFSSIRAGWSPRNRPYLSSTEFVAGLFGREAVSYCQKIESNGSMLQRHVLTWCLENVSMIRAQHSPRRSFIPYEEFVTKGDEAVDKLSITYNLPARDKMLAMLRRPSNASKVSFEKERLKFIRTGNMDALIGRWRNQISKPEERSAMAILEALGLDVYKFDNLYPTAGMLFKGETAARVCS